MVMVSVDVQPIIEKIRAKVIDIGKIRALKGIGKNVGYFLVILEIDVHRDLKIKINVEQMLTNKHYFDNLISEIYDLKAASDKRVFEQCRITV